ncbi:hypothetical protein ACNKHM_26075 [Shigella sonnei]
MVHFSVKLAEAVLLTACLLRVLAFLEAVMEDFLTEEAVLLLVVLLLAAVFLAGFLGLLGGCRAFLFICFFGDMSGSRTLPGLL